MSSSKIIKPGGSREFRIAPFCLEMVEAVAPPPREERQEGAFVPFLESLLTDGNDDAAGEADGGGECQAPAVVIAGVPEEEHVRQVRESYDRGFDDGKRQAERGLANVFKTLREAIEDISRLKGQILRETEEDILEMVFRIAKKVVHQEIATDRLILAKIVSAAVNNSSERNEVVIRLNPEDHRLVSAHKNLYLNGLSEERQLDLKSDETITPGGCIVETITGEIDARAETQLDEMFRRLMDERNNTPVLGSKLMVERDSHAYEEN